MKNAEVQLEGSDHSIVIKQENTVSEHLTDGNEVNYNLYLV